MSTDTQDIIESVSPQEAKDPLIEKVQVLETRIAQLEQMAHTEHSLNADTINQIAKVAVQQAFDHLTKTVKLGRTLLQEE